MDARSFQQLADLLPEPMLLVTRLGEVVACNSAAAALAGARRGELAGVGLGLLVDGAPEALHEQLGMWARTKQAIPGTLRWRRNGGAPEEWRADGGVVREAGEGGPALIILRLRPKMQAVSQFRLLSEQVQALTREVMQRRKAELALAAEREWLRVTLASIGDAVIAIDCEDSVTYLNGVAQSLTGWTQEEALGRPLREVFPIYNELTGEPVENPCEKVRRTGAVVGLANHTVLRDRSGLDRPIEDSAAPIYSADGELIGVVMVFHDVTEKRRAERALAAEREWLRVTLASIGDAVITTDEEGRVTFMNPVAEELTRWQAGEARGRDITEVFDIVNEYTREVVESPVTRVLREGAVVGLANHTVLRRRDGTEVPIDDSGAPIKRDGGDLMGAVLVFRDITERHRNEAALREREALFRTMADSAPVLIWVADQTKLCTFFNKPWLDYTGRSIVEEMGTGWAEGVHPDDLERCLGIYTGSFDRREPFSMEYRLRGADGEYRWFLDTGVPRLAPDGTFEGFIGSLVDVTDQVRAREVLAERGEELNRLVEARTRELEASHVRLRMAERMASIGTLAAGLGHDMGNLLLPVRMRLEVLEASNLDDAQREDIRAVRTCTEYLQRLSNGLRLLALGPESQGSAGAVTELGSWWQDVEPMLRNTLPRGVTLAHMLPAEPVGVRLARHLLTQAVFNLVQNAGQAMSQASGASGAGPADAVRGEVRVWAEVSESGVMVRVGVTDNGPGMTEAVKRRCLEPFFTTKTRAISTGLGLSLVQGIVAAAGGSIEIHSEPGKGATFVLVLPRATIAGPDAEDRRAELCAVVTLSDARQRSVVESLLAAHGVAVLHRPRTGAGEAEQPGPGLWITDAGADHRAEVELFLAERLDRIAVVLGTWGDVDPARTEGASGEPRIVELSGPGRQSQLAKIIIEFARRSLPG